MTAVARSPVPVVSHRGKALVLLAILALGVFAVAAPLIMAWPHSVSAPKTRFNLGSAADYGIGSVTRNLEGRFHLVRLSEDDFIALSWRNPGYKQCTVPWRPTFAWPDASGTLTKGWFRDPCYGSTFDRSGVKVFGPALRNMDRYPVSIVGGDVVVDTDAYVCGFAPPDGRCVDPATHTQ